ncbi:HTH-transcriptional regulator, RpiR family [Gottschalkia acidurici 9a]|uniref:HTH-transcriptional regulator, RpiR family n=1 Tax=Gottschalkia acidurici (strain ATCC 7906 / DSM 604 / BCRC 14475 / CIP 104303 / KCTC 5404 / NCIMB 10678 / 9a) TaxID=1128398 RepID=K0B1C1_GOTA9|nr:MurR/RpiR family transcriptional regulator [Gottschalkia acidurici]AFS78441.1 HTH-transcriptional regulator, RpiR family [Gottschalkia acidurici 9a]
MEEKIDLINLIKEKFEDLSKGQKLIANYIISNYDKAAFMTAARLGQVVGISESTVVRFANTMGYDGYPNLQSELQELIKSKLTTVQRLSMSQDDYSNKNIGVRKILKTDMENIRHTIDDIDTEIFEEVVNSILKAKKVYILGLRSSNALSSYLGFYLGVILDDVKVVNLGISDIFEQLIRVTKDDVVIGISYPRYSRRTLDALKYVRDQGCKVIGITDSEASPITSIAHLTLFARNNMVSFVDSLVAPMSLINALIVSIGMRVKNEVAEYFQELENIWEEYNIYDRKL